MTAFEHHFLPLDPPVSDESYKDLQTLGEVGYLTHSGFTLPVRYLGMHEQVRVIAVTIPAAAVGHDDQKKWMTQIIEGSIAALRLGGDPRAIPIYTELGFINLMYESDDSDPLYQVKIIPVVNPNYKLNIFNVMGIFSSIYSRELLAILSLLGEAQVPSIPIHYKTLSLIRAIELIHPEKKDYNRALSKFDKTFAELAVSSSKLREFLPQLRTRCAHGRSRGRKNPEPFIGLGYNAEILITVKRLLQTIVLQCLLDKYGLKSGGVTPE